jgi:hypothetical protein
MKFEEIFNKEGLYVAESFGEGVALKIEGDTLYSCIYKNEDDLFPEVRIQPVYKGLFDKEYTKVFTRQSLFNKNKNGI